ncbi:MAG: hypothetical protein IPI34_15210 [bacterium]|nr:hypothetical protein [bacterium]
MPELPEVESVARTLRTALSGRRLTGMRVRHAVCVEPSAAAVRRAVLGRTLDRVHRRGKYLVLTFGQGDPAPAHLMLHLRMTGQVLFEPADRPDRHVHLVLDFAGAVQTPCRDARKFGRWTCDDAENPSALDHAGPTCWEIRASQPGTGRLRRRRALPSPCCWTRGCRGGRTSTPTRPWFRARIHPLRRPADCSDAELRRVFDAVRGVLRLAVEHGGTTFLDFRDFHGQPGNFRRKLRVFQRDGGALPGLRGRAMDHGRGGDAFLLGLPALTRDGLVKSPIWMYFNGSFFRYQSH